jgi:hypothetical protein
MLSFIYKENERKDNQMLSLHVESVKKDYMGCTNYISQTISVKDEAQANRWLDAIASDSTILETSLV